MSSTKVTIEVVDGNPLNEGWLLYLLGQPRPDEPGDPEPGTDPTRAILNATARVDGWDMGHSTPTIGIIRRVFEGSGAAYAVTIGEPEAVPTTKKKEPVTE